MAAVSPPEYSNRPGRRVGPKRLTEGIIRAEVCRCTMLDKMVHPCREAGTQGSAIVLTKYRMLLEYQLLKAAVSVSKRIKDTMEVKEPLVGKAIYQTK